MRDSLGHIHIYTPGLDLRSKLAERFGTQVKNVITGSGSEGIMANIVRSFLRDNNETLTSESA